MKLAYKFFITLFATALLTLVLVVVVMHFSLRKNFIQYVNEAEFDKMTLINDRLRQSYVRHQGWNEFKSGQYVWYEFVKIWRPGVFQDNPRPPGKAAPPPPHPMGTLPLHHRLCLFNPDKSHVAGDYTPGDRFTYRAVTLPQSGKNHAAGNTPEQPEKKDSRQIIGWLGLKVLDMPSTPLELAFLSKQVNALYIIGLCIFALALVVSLFMARHLLNPIRELAQGTRAMRNFDFSTTIQIRSRDELGELANDFNRMAATLKQYETLRKNWISDISHELRTPVAVIRSKIEALQDGIRTMTPELTASLHKDVLALGTLVNDLHLVAMADSRTLAADLKRVSLPDIFSQTLSGFLIRIEKKGLSIQEDWKKIGLSMVLGDPDLLGRVFANLLENTLQYTDAPGILRVTHDIENGSAILCIEDSAPGVPGDALALIFNRLYRVDRSRNRASGGSGLGLSICKNMIAMHKGTIHAGHSVLGGLKIEIKLPLYRN